MLLWLLGVAIFVVLWGAVWKASAKGGFGVLIGLLLAWFFSRFMTPYVTGMENIPLWLPPLPLALVAVTLFVFGLCALSEWCACQNDGVNVRLSDITMI